MEQKLKRKGVESAYGSKKPRLEGAPQARINPLYQSTDLQEKIRDAWRYVILTHLPCIIDIIANSSEAIISMLVCTSCVATCSKATSVHVDGG